LPGGADPGIPYRTEKPLLLTKEKPMSRPQGFEFRCAKADEMPQFHRVASYVFASPPTGDDPPSPLDPSWTQCAFKDEKIVAISGAFPLTVRLDGKTAKVHGIHAVGTEPAFRRKGLVRRLITDLLHRGKEEGQVGSMLLASMGAIYQRFGYGLASRVVSYEFDPREAELQFPLEVTGRMERMNKADAMPHVVEVFGSYSQDRNLLALRHEVVWENLLSGVEKDKAYCAVHFDDNARADGYCIYSTRWSEGRRSGPPQDLNISDLAYTSMNGYRGIWEYIRSHDLVGRVSWGNVPEDDLAEGILLEPRCLHKTSRDGLWFRVIDVAGLLAARGYSIDGDVTLAVEGDELCPWNNGSYALSVRDGKGVVTSGKGGEPDIVCSVNGLASLVTGYADPRWLDRIGRLGAGDPSRLDFHNQLFSTRHRPALSFAF